MLKELQDTLPLAQERLIVVERSRNEAKAKQRPSRRLGLLVLHHIVRIGIDQIRITSVRTAVQNILDTAEAIPWGK